MAVEINESNLKQGVLGLVVTLVEIIRDAMRLQALKRIEGDSLTDEEIERLGRALMDLDEVIDEIKKDHGVDETVRSIRDGLDDIACEVIDKIISPERWPAAKVQGSGSGGQGLGAR